MVKTFRPSTLLGRNLFFRKALLFAVVVCPGMSCTNMAEYDITWQSSLVTLSSVDLSVTSVFQEVTSPRCIMVCPGYVFIASTEGKVYSFSTAGRELTGESIVGAPSPSGYSGMVYSPDEGTAYLIGAAGKILELSIPDCLVIDEFTVCASPAELEISPGNPGFLWVADPTENTIHRVNLQTNASYGQVNYSGETLFQCMEASFARDTLLVGTSYLVYRLEVLESGGLRSTFIDGLTGSFEDISAIPGEAFYIAVVSDMIGVLYPYGDYTFSPSSSFTAYDALEGDLHQTAAGSDSVHAYVLSYLGGGISRISSFSCGEDIGIDRYVDLEGYPLDIEVSEEGDIYVLAY